MNIIEVKTRQYIGTHIARVDGHSCSRTTGVDQAVDTLKQKHFPRGIVKKILPNSEVNRNRLKKGITHLIIIR